MDSIYECADVVICPFRTTSGSDSIVHALARGKVIFASDLPLNSELNRRVPGCVAEFKVGDPSDLALKLKEMMDSSPRRAALANHASEYAKTYSIPSAASDTVKVYQQI